MILRSENADSASDLGQTRSPSLDWFSLIQGHLLGKNHHMFVLSTDGQGFAPVVRFGVTALVQVENGQPQHRLVAQH
jgi:hypothetical protein